MLNQTLVNVEHLVKRAGDVKPESKINVNAIIAQLIRH